MNELIYKVTSIISLSLFMFFNGYLLRGIIEHSKRSPILTMIVLGISYIVMIVVGFYHYKGYFK